MAGAGNRLAVGAEGVGGDVQPLLGACLVDRPVPAPAHRLQVAALEQHLHEAAVAGPAAHLGGGRHRILHRHHDRGTQPRVAVQPLRYLPVVGGPRQGRGELQVPHQAGGRHRIQHRPGNAVRIEEVPAGEVQLRSGAAAGRRTRILARPHEPRVVAAVGGAHAERIQVIAPAARQVGVQVLDGVDLVVQVAVDDRGSRRRGRLGGGNGRPIDQRCGRGLAHDLALRPSPCNESDVVIQQAHRSLRSARDQAAPPPPGRRAHSRQVSTTSGAGALPVAVAGIGRRWRGLPLARRRAARPRRRSGSRGTGYWPPNRRCGTWNTAIR